MFASLNVQDVEAVNACSSSISDLAEVTCTIIGTWITNHPAMQVLLIGLSAQPEQQVPLDEISDESQLEKVNLGQLPAQ